MVEYGNPEHTYECPVMGLCLPCQRIDRAFREVGAAIMAALVANTMTGLFEPIREYQRNGLRASPAEWAIYMPNGIYSDVWSEQPYDALMVEI